MREPVHELLIQGHESPCDESNFLCDGRHGHTQSTRAAYHEESVEHNSDCGTSSGDDEVVVSDEKLDHTAHIGTVFGQCAQAYEIPSVAARRKRMDTNHT